MYAHYNQFSLNCLIFILKWIKCHRKEKTAVFSQLREKNLNKWGIRHKICIIRRIIRFGMDRTTDIDEDDSKNKRFWGDIKIRMGGQEIAESKQHSFIPAALRWWSVSKMWFSSKILFASIYFGSNF